MGLYRNIAGFITDTAAIGAISFPYGRYVFLKNVNGLYVDSKQGAAYMTCDNNNPGLYEAFLVLDGGAGTTCFMASNGKYVTRQDAEGTPMIANRAQAFGWERFIAVDNGDGTFSLQGDNGLFVSSENGQSPMTCNRSAVGGWEKFTYEMLPTDYSFNWLFGSSTPSTVDQATNATLPPPPPPPPAIAVPATPTPATTPVTPVTTVTTTQVTPTIPKSSYIPLFALAGAMVIAVTDDFLIHHHRKLAFAGGIGLLYYLLNRQT